jgi:hypothetical protein
MQFFLLAKLFGLLAGIILMYQCSGVALAGAGAGR